MFGYDTQLGRIEADGIKSGHVPLPASIPHIGGLYLTAGPDTLKEHRNRAVGIGRCDAKTHVLIRENARAAAHIFLQIFPDAEPKENH